MRPDPRPVHDTTPATLDAEAERIRKRRLAKAAAREARRGTVVTANPNVRYDGRGHAHVLPNRRQRRELACGRGVQRDPQHPNAHRTNHPAKLRAQAAYGRVRT